MLINEYYKITTNLTNNHDGAIDNVSIIISLPTNLLNKVFLLAEEPSPVSKLSSRIQIDVGAMKARANASIFFFITSMVEGNIELRQSLCYQTENRNTIDDSSTFNQVSSPSDAAKNIEKCFADKDDQHEIVVENLDNNIVRKRRDNILIVPCVTEFIFESKFFTLNRKPAISCFKDEDLIMRCTLDMTSPFNLEIIDAFFIADVNIEELSNQNRNFIKKDVARGTQAENLVILRPNRTSAEWATKETFVTPVNSDASKIFDEICSEESRKESNVKEVTNENEDDPFALKSKDQKLNYANNNEASKKVSNSVLAVTKLIESNDGRRKGFINAKLNLLDEKSIDPTRKFGMYCIKWKKSDSDIINESKFVIKGIGKTTKSNHFNILKIIILADVKEPLLNIYCAIDERVYVREYFTYKVTLKNPHESLLNLLVTFNVNSTDGFMFAGHRQVNVVILSCSQFDLTFNLYPLKSNFQRLPELKLEFINSHDDGVATKENLIESSLKPEISQKQVELNELLKRWLPKSVFIHVSSWVFAETFDGTLIVQIFF